jgi:anti-anti-sigma factor
MSIDTRADRVVVATLADEKLKADLEALLVLDVPRPPRIVLDFTAVRHINSSSIARLLRLRQSVIEAEGKLSLFGMNPQVMSVLRVTGLDKVFQLVDNVDAGLLAVRL